MSDQEETVTYDGGAEMRDRIIKDWYPKGCFGGALPIELDDVTKAFPAQIENLMPPAKNIPIEMVSGDSEWSDLACKLALGATDSNLKMYPKEGVNAQLAGEHIMAICRSYQPKHEYKEAAVCYLLDKWFDRYTD